MKIHLKNVRLSFPHLFMPKPIKNSEPKYSANFLLNKINDAAQIDTLRSACRAVATEKWPVKLPKGLMFCVHEGSEKDYDGYGPMVLFLNSTSTVRPSVVDRNLSPLTADDGKPYAGCFCHCAVRLWAQDNEYGKRINAQLLGVQFFRDGENFGEKPFNATEEFSDISGAEGGFVPTPAGGASDGDGGPDNPNLPDIPF